MRFCHCLLLLLPGLSPFVTKAQVSVIDSLGKIVQENKKDIEENKALNLLTTLYTRTDMAKAKTYAYNSIDLASSLRNDVTLSVAY